MAVGLKDPGLAAPKGMATQPAGLVIYYSITYRNADIFIIEFFRIPGKPGRIPFPDLGNRNVPGF